MIRLGFRLRLVKYLYFDVASQKHTGDCRKALTSKKKKVWYNKAVTARLGRLDRYIWQRYKTAIEYMTGTTHTHIHSVARYHIGLLGRNAHARTQADKLTNRLARAPRYGVFSFRSLATRWWWRLNIVVACLLGYFRRRSIANGNPVTAPCATELLTTTRSELSPITCPLTETSSAFTCTSNPREDYKPQVLSVLALAALESHAVFSSLFTVNILLSVNRAFVRSQT